MSELPDPPDWLDEPGQRMWIKKTIELHERDLYTPMVDETLMAYCQAYSDLVYAVRFLKENDRICMSEKGGEYQHPMVGQKNTSIAQMIQLGKALSMTPKEIARLKVKTVEDEEDEVAAMMED